MDLKEALGQLQDLSSYEAKRIFNKSTNSFGMSVAVPLVHWLKVRCGGYHKLDPYYLTMLFSHLRDPNIKGFGHVAFILRELLENKENINMLKKSPQVLEAMLITLSRFSMRSEFEELLNLRLSMYDFPDFDAESRRRIWANATKRFSSSFVASMNHSFNNFVEKLESLKANDPSGRQVPRVINDVVDEDFVRVAASAVNSLDARKLALILMERYRDERKGRAAIRNKVITMFFTIAEKVYARRGIMDIESALESLLSWREIRASIRNDKDESNRPWDPLDRFEHVERNVFSVERFQGYGCRMLDNPYFPSERGDFVFKHPLLTVSLNHISHATIVMDGLGFSSNPEMHKVIPVFMQAALEFFKHDHHLNLYNSYWEALCRSGDIEGAVSSCEAFDWKARKSVVKTAITLFSFISRLEDSALAQNYLDRMVKADSRFLPFTKAKARHNLLSINHEEWRTFDRAL